jgi:hypothetical protein
MGVRVLALECVLPAPGCELGGNVDAEGTSLSWEEGGSGCEMPVGGL